MLQQTLIASVTNSQSLIHYGGPSGINPMSSFSLAITNVELISSSENSTYHLKFNTFTIDTYFSINEITSSSRYLVVTGIIPVFERTNALSSQYVPIFLEVAERESKMCWLLGFYSYNDCSKFLKISNPQSLGKFTFNVNPSLISQQPSPSITNSTISVPSIFQESFPVESFTPSSSSIFDDNFQKSPLSFQSNQYDLSMDPINLFSFPSMDESSTTEEVYVTPLSAVSTPDSDRANLISEVSHSNLDSDTEFSPNLRTVNSKSSMSSLGSVEEEAFVGGGCRYVLFKVSGFSLNQVLKNWSKNEIKERRRLCEFYLSPTAQDDDSFNLHLQITDRDKWIQTNEQYTTDEMPSTIVSCIVYDDNYFVTSVDLINVYSICLGKPLEALTKNRVRRVLEKFKPVTIRRGHGMFDIIMRMEDPKPRKIEKEVKVFKWDDLALAVKAMLAWSQKA